VAAAAGGLSTVNGHVGWRRRRCVAALTCLCARQNANKRPKQDVLIDSLNGLALKDAPSDFLEAVPKIRPLAADGRRLAAWGRGCGCGLACVCCCLPACLRAVRLSRRGAC
jgi:hypothetical protein